MVARTRTLKLYFVGLATYAMYTLADSGVTGADVIAWSKNALLTAYARLSDDPMSTVSNVYAVLVENRAIQMVLVWALFKALAYYFKLRVERDEAREEVQQAGSTPVVDKSIKSGSKKKN